MLQMGATSSKLNMYRLSICKSKPTVVVGLDFGTTFAGFAYALVSDPEKVYKFYEWPALAAAKGKNYCKTPTTLLYKRVSGEDHADSYALKDWAYGAILAYAANEVQSQQHNDDQLTGSNCNESRRGTSSSYDFIAGFKLLLAGKDSETLARADNDGIKLPDGLKVRRTVSDYLRKISELIVDVLKKHLGSHMSMEDIQWCLTVPAIWNELAKQEMKACAELAGLIQGQHCLDQEASPHPLIMVLEPEAASLYCQLKNVIPLTIGDRFLVVDVGGGTVDLVLHEKVRDLKVREVSPSSGGFCGAQHVDQGFLKFLSRKIVCFREVSMQHPQLVLEIKESWETFKHSFDGTMNFPYPLDVPTKLARAWEEDYLSSQNFREENLVSSFDVIDLSLEDVLSIFDPVVDEILELIQRKMIEGLKAIMVVGGFSNSPYLIKRITQDFSEKVDAIIVPDEPGSAICCGAVSYGVRGADLVVSRFAKKTYGISHCRPFSAGDPTRLTMLGPGGRQYCNGIFEAYVRNGEEVGLDQCFSHIFSPTFTDETKTEVCLYSTFEAHPKYVDDLGVRKEGSFIVRHPSKQQLGGIVPKFRVSLWFGRSSIEVMAVGRNFGKGENFSMPPVTFEESLEEE